MVNENQSPNEKSSLINDDYKFLFDNSKGFIRIPIWGHIPLTDFAKSVIAHPNFFRLRGIKQLSFVEYVFPGATHTRLEHCIGVFHLTKSIFQSLVLNEVNFDNPQKKEFLKPENIKTLLAGALLHDLGHYPHAHLVETLKFSKNESSVFTHHQEMAEKFLFEKVDGISIADILENEWKIDPKRVVTIINGNKKKEPIAKIVSGTLDPDKMDYIIRDAHHCSVPYASVDIGRLIESFVLDIDRNRLAITEKGIAPFESLIFSKYMMTRHIYWHHTVKSFGSMLKLFVQEALDKNIISSGKLMKIFYESNDEELLFRLLEQFKKHREDFGFVELLELLKKRKPYKSLVSVVFSKTENTSFKKGIVRIPTGVMDHLSERSAKKLKSSNNLINTLNKLHLDPVFRRKTELNLIKLLNKKHQNQLEIKEHELIIDAPGFDSIFEYDDLRELQVYDPKGNNYFSLNGSHLTMFQPEFISGFEPFSKELQVLVHPRLLTLLKDNKTDILRELIG